MKSIQVTMDEELLAKLDACDEVHRDGRSAVLRRAVEHYLTQRRRHSIAVAYRNAYSKTQGLGDEYSGWEGQGEWPKE